jgi:ATP-binding cassette subfamily B protein
MLNVVRRLLKISGKYSGRLKTAIVTSILEGFFILAPVVLVLYALHKILTDSIVSSDVWLFAGLIVVSILFRALFRRITDGLQSGTGYSIFADGRMALGDHLKRLPMGFYSEGSLGNVTAVATSDIVFAEAYGMESLSKIVNAYISMILGTIFITVIDWRMGLIALGTYIGAYYTLNRLNSVAIDQSEKRQEGQARMTSGVLEFVRGISVIKAFNLTGEKAERINEQFREFRDISINFEKKFLPVVKRYLHVFAAGIALVILTATWFALNGTMDLFFMYFIIIYIFYFFSPFQALSSLTPRLRIMERGLDRYEEIMNAEIIDADGRDIELEQFDVEFRNVGFAYEEEKVLHDISFKAPERSMTALVGRSGCGKTTIANLTARFWDVDEGEVLVGGINVKDITCDSLLRNISMVFQDVYLFNDTILNNVRFGKPEAGMEEVVAACKKARAHDFISALENGYDTMVEEGGKSLSGGEKQRISIARAILKDAPIILLDEATTSVDPDNEQYIQKAINELVRDKTLIVIAHKLSTIRNADQILVIDDGRIVQRGIHDELIRKEGIFRTFWERRARARSWKIFAVGHQKAV